MNLNYLLNYDARLLVNVQQKYAECYEIVEVTVTSQLVRLAQMPTNQQAAFHRGLSDHKPFEDTEWQANAFASSLLMPARGLAVLEELYGRLSAAMIANTFKVSQETASYRLALFEQRKGELLLA